MRINTINWQTYRLMDLFEIKRGAFSNVTDAHKGTIPLVTAFTQNNGVSQFIEEDDRYVVEGNCLTVANTGQGSVFRTFYQPFRFIPSNNVSVLTPKFELNEHIGLFICTLCWLEIPKYSYGRIVNNDRLNETILKLPSINNQPDWDFMEKYIKSLKYKKITTENKNINIPISTVEWKEFKIGDLFLLKKCKCGQAGELIDGADIYYIGAKKNDNGVMKSVSYDNSLITKGNCIIFICDGQGSVGYANYMNKDFIGSTTLTAGYNPNLNRYNALFIVTLLDKERYKYSYGRKYGPHLSNTFIKLPTKNNEPDWQFMEDYIKSLPYADRI